MPSSIVAVAPDPTIVNGVTIITNAATMEAGTHRAILQRLNRRVGDNYFPADQFAQSVDSWAGIPNIFANQHPDLDAFDADPEAELKRINGRIVGTVKNPEIVIAGGARLEADEDFGGDAEVEALNLAGELTGSTAFRCAPILNASVDSPPRPHHVLWFREDLANRGVDPGVVILNKEETVDTITNAGKVVSTANAGKFRQFLAGLAALFKDMTGEDIAEVQTNKAEETPAIVEAEQTIEALADPGQEVTNMEKEAEYLTQIANKEIEIQNKDARIADLEAKNAQYQKERRDADWATILNRIPVGWTDTPEKEAEIRKEFEETPTILINKILDLKRTPEKPEVEAIFVNKDLDKAQAEALDTVRELRRSTGRFC